MINITRNEEVVLNQIKIYDKEFSEVYKQVMTNPRMQAFEKAKQGLLSAAWFGFASSSRLPVPLPL